MLINSVIYHLHDTQKNLNNAENRFQYRYSEKWKVQISDATSLGTRFFSNKGVLNF